MLRSFVRVAQTESFSAAAREIGATQPAISRQIATLEEHFGVRLLHRTTRSLSLTADGRELLEHAQAVLDSIEGMEAAIGTRRNAPTGRVRLSTPVSFGLHLTSRMAVFRERYPGLSLELVIRDGFFADMVEEGLDLAMRVGEGPEASIIARHAGTVRLLTVAAPSYLATHAAPLVPADLTEHDCLVFRFSPQSHEWAFDGPEGHVMVPVSGPFSANNSEAVHQAVLDGLGIGSLPELVVGPDLLTGRLRPILTAYHRPETPVYLVYPSRRNLPLRTRAVIDFVIREAAQCRVFGTANRLPVAV